MNPNGPVRWGWMNNKAADGLGERSVQIIHSTLRTMRSEAMREELTSTVGTVVEPPNLNRFFDELIAKARVRHIRFHDLRHTCASLLLAQNVPARVVMEILGHSQLAMTTDLSIPT